MNRPTWHFIMNMLTMLAILLAPCADSYAEVIDSDLESGFVESVLRNEQTATMFPAKTTLRSKPSPKLAMPVSNLSVTRNQFKTSGEHILLICCAFRE